MAITSFGFDGDPSLHSDTKLFVSACFNAGVALTSTQVNAVNQLVKDLHGMPNPGYATFNVWNDLIALYPFVGGSAASHKFNLKDPRDADAAFRLLFVGSPAHGATGWDPNGTTQYADTFIIPNSHVPGNQSTYAVYTRQNGGAGCDLGVRTEGNAYVSIWAQTSGFTFATLRQGAGNVISYAASAIPGLYLTTTDGSNSYFYENGVHKQTILLAGTKPLHKLVLGANNNPPAGGVISFSNREQALALITKSYFDNAKQTFFKNANHEFQTMLSRQV